MNGFLLLVATPGPTYYMYVSIGTAPICPHADAEPLPHTYTIIIADSVINSEANTTTYLRIW